MTNELKDICRSLITGTGESRAPVFFYGDYKETSPLEKLITIGASRNLELPVYKTNGYSFPRGEIVTLADGVAASVGATSPESGLVVFSCLEELSKDEGATRRFLDLIDRLCTHGVQLVLLASCPPEGLPFPESLVAQLRTGLVFCLDGEEFGMPVRELMEMGLWPNAGRFASLYRAGFLEVFPVEKTEILSAAQEEQLKEMKRVVHALSEQYRGLFSACLSKTGTGLASREEAKALTAEELTAQICYVFWNRFNSGPEGYEVDFARSGALGFFLRQLKEKDETGV